METVRIGFYEIQWAALHQMILEKSILFIELILFFIFRQDIKDFLEKSDKDNIIVGSCNAFQRKLIYQMICNEFANEISTTGQTIDKNKVIVVERKLTDEQQANLLQEKNDKDEEEVRRLVGMSMLMEKISESVRFSKFDFFSLDF